ncbi:MAG TPA: hypothetical protein VFR41_06685, partial [Acidimicrobiia bacterium]|nr:hypothetical protein [Acidimicrobiia bacterium]
ADAWSATAWVISERIARTLPELDLASVLALHPALPPGFNRHVEESSTRVTCVLTPERPDLVDADTLGWIGALARGDRRGIEGVVHGFDRMGVVTDVLTTADTIAITVEKSGTEPANPPPALDFMRVGTLAAWEFRPRGAGANP